MAAETIPVPPIPSQPTPPLTEHLTIEEYLELERRTGIRYEYVDGVVRAMAGETLAHNIIAGNIFVQFRTAFRDRPCEAFMENVKVRVTPTRYFYPDVVALCGDPLVDDTQPPALLNPSVIVEVLSPSTEDADRDDKRLQYRQIADLTDYVLVAQDQRRVTHYTRQSNSQWASAEYIAENDTLRFAGLDVELPLAEIYRKITLGGQNG